MLIVLDMDDILTQTNQQWLDWYNRDYGDDRTLEDIKGWNTHYWVRPDCGQEIYKYLNSTGFYRTMKPVDWAIGGVRELFDKGHDVVIATASPINSYTAVEEKKEWIREYLPEFDLKNFMVCHRKDLLRGQVIFDDGAHNCQDFRGISVCLNRPWNRGEDCSDLRVDGWLGFMEQVDMMMDNKGYYFDLLDRARRRCRNNIDG